ncbi:hypothetical protein Fmac_030290 [Flemingia macrophylla]|uniref:Avr9/Cf-9 rapidly elicited protein 146 n=1 Tax=Flemingia macrophylla TaxID=520843 RepID=A0ABD1LCX2_9FABA
MEIQPSPGPGPSPSPSPSPQAVRKLWNVVRIVFLILRRGIAKSKSAVDLNVLLKRGRLAAAKAAAVTLLHHRDDALVHPRTDYEFSCSNSPALSFPFKKRKHQRLTRCHHHHHHHHDVLKALQILNDDGDDKVAVEASPLGGRRRVRVTDSPFPAKEDEEGDEVDVAAEEFIKRFYRNLNLQRKMAAAESPHHYDLWDR